MHPRDLLAHKLAPKSLQEIPVFKGLKRGKLPRPFHKMGGDRVESTGLIDVSSSHVVVFIARAGALLTDTAFFGYLLCRLANGSLSPLFEFHWHPSHKGFHCKTPCRATQTYTDRLLVQAIEIDMKSDPTLDPRETADRLKLINIVCRACGITLGGGLEDAQGQLWK